MRLGGNQKIDLIRKVPLFARCSRAELKEIALLADEIDLHEGKEMTREGAPGREFFVLLDGTADVKKKSRRVNTLGPGDFFGEIALVSREPRTATVIATSPIRALVITDRSFRRLLDDAPQVQTKVMEAMAQRLAPETL
jgi:CRP/FNR family transcriptional regulator, cyclic AMP receptor protein